MICKLKRVDTLKLAIMFLLYKLSEHEEHFLLHCKNNKHIAFLQKHHEKLVHLDFKNKNTETGVDFLNPYTFHK